MIYKAKTLIKFIKNVLLISIFIANANNYIFKKVSYVQFLGFYLCMNISNCFNRFLNKNKNIYINTVFILCGGDTGANLTSSVLKESNG